MPGVAPQDESRRYQDEPIVHFENRVAMNTAADEFVRFGVDRYTAGTRIPTALYDHGFLPGKGRPLRALLLRGARLAAAKAKAVRAVVIPRQRTREPDVARR